MMYSTRFLVFRNPFLTFPPTDCSAPPHGVLYDGDVTISRFWAEVEAKAGHIDKARAVWADVLAQGGYSGRHDLWLEWIAFERFVQTEL